MKLKFEEWKQSFKQSMKGFYKAMPVIIGIIFLLSFLKTIIPSSALVTLFSQHYITNTLIGSTLGSVMAGNPITSYIISGELLEHGVSLVAVTAFIVSWTTVGIIQYPAERKILGKRFALYRNITSFLCSILSAIITVVVVGAL
ncbi:MAG: permease [Nanobdellota archaeon]